MVKNKKIILVMIMMIGFIFAVKPLAFRGFDLESSNEIYGRGDYLIVLGSSTLNSFLIDENLGGDFVKFKQSQGFNVNIIAYDDLGFTTPEQLRDYIHLNYDNGMLEYVLFIGDVNGEYAIPPFTIQSYNEQEIDVTDYPYTFIDVNEYQNPKFLTGRWPIRDIPELLAVKVKSIQYVTNENLIDFGDDLTFYNDALLVAGNYKTADGAEVPPNEWPVTPVWTSLWLYDELLDYGYAKIDTAFFHQNNYQTAENNPLIKSKWDEGIGVVNYRGWGDATGWHKPSFHLQEATSLSNQWRLPVVMSFVCNTGDYGNDYIDPAGYSKCFGELLVTSGSIITPKGAAAMVGPSDLDTDTRFNNVMCGVMWDGILSGKTPELASALHYGKNALINEFDGLVIENTDNMTFDFFYHHVYTVLGDPSLPVLLEKPKIMRTTIDQVENIDNYGHSVADSPLTNSYIQLRITDEDGSPLEDVVGVLFADNEPFLNSDGLLYKGVSNYVGNLTFDFDLSTDADLDLYLNKAQYLQRKISIDYLALENNVSPDLDITIELIGEINNDIYAVPGNDYNLNITITNSSQYDLDNINLSDVCFKPKDWHIYLGCDDFISSSDDFSIPSGQSYLINESLQVPSSISSGDITFIHLGFNHNIFDLGMYPIEIIVSNDSSEYLESLPSPESYYGYRAYDNFDMNYDDAPEYSWIELNIVNEAENLGLEDDTLIKKALPFDFKYFGKTYNQGEMLTICSNGWVSLEDTDIDHFWNFSIPSPMGPSAMIAPFMDDLDDNNGSEPFNVWYFYDQVNHKLIIEWDNVSNGEDDEYCPNCVKESFQMILFDPQYHQTISGDGEIVFQYKSIYDIDQNGVYSTIGIESPEQNDGVQYLYNNNPGLGSFWQSDELDGKISGIAIKFTTGNNSSCSLYDINKDGIVNVQDIVAAVSFALGTSVPLSDQLCAADTDGNGFINVVDIVAIVSAALGSL